MNTAQRLIAFAFTLAVAAAAGAEPAPDFAFQTDNGALRIADQRGKVVYLDYWASWCVPCKQSFPWMNDLHARYRDKGLVVLAVNLDKERAEANRFLASHPAKFTVAYDPDGATARVMALKGMPTSFLIDRNGRIASTHIGFRESGKDKVESEIRALLAR
jgi:thiol-disulfide isomerase/thioredoxin